jgi:putative endonuclease
MPQMTRQYFVYILASPSRTLYTGVTNDVVKRLHQHRAGRGSRFSAKYRVSRLVYVEETTDIIAAIAREKQIKSWTRAKKVALIESVNSAWADLNQDLS